MARVSPLKRLSKEIEYLARKEGSVMRFFVLFLFVTSAIWARGTVVREESFRVGAGPVITEGSTLVLPFFEGNSVVLDLGAKNVNLGIASYSARSKGSFMNNASVVEIPGGCLARVKDPITGHICSFRFIEGCWFVQEETVGNHGICGTVKPGYCHSHAAAKAKSVKKVALTGDPKVDGAALMAKGERSLNEIDVLIAIDGSAAKWIREKTNYGAVPGVNALALFAAEAIERCNATLANTELNAYFRFRLAGYIEVTADFSSQRDRYGNVDSESLLEQMVGERTAPSAFRSAISAIRAKRESCYADIVSCLVSCGQDEALGTIGVGYLLDNDTIRYASMGDMAYNVCLVEAVATDNTLVHEIGHNMGAGHAQMKSVLESGPQLYDYSSGYYFTLVNESVALHGTTVMGYNTDGWEDDFGYAERWGRAPGVALDPDSWNGGLFTSIDYFSSARHTYKYFDETGCVVDSGVVLGDAKHDNTRLLSLTYPVVANYRVRGSSTTLSESWNKARKLSAVLASSGTPVTRLELKVGRANAKSRRVKVSGSLIDLSAKKMGVVAGTAVVANDSISLSLVVRGSASPLVVTVSGSGLVTAKWGTSALANLSCGGALAGTAHAVAVASSFTLLSGERRELLPVGRSEAFAATASRWTFPPAAKVRYNKKVGRVEVDSTGGRTNLSAMKLSYKVSTGVFKGTFKVYVLAAGKMKKYRVVITGLVAGGKGYGLATCKNPAGGPWIVEIR